MKKIAVVIALLGGGAILGVLALILVGVLSSRSSSPATPAPAPVAQNLPKPADAKSATVAAKTEASSAPATSATTAAAEQSPNPIGKQSNEVFDPNKQPAFAPFVQCVDHMVATRPVFIVLYDPDSGEDVLQLAPSETKVRNMCFAPWEQACGGDAACINQTTIYIGTKLVERWHGKID